ncbi:hypothetical protein F4777DRAFT_172206 [Nemania sp. FL0916]|nr:hypothetical protein F4777DRAFT_172206 [Nemania sp. FL0916]
MAPQDPNAPTDSNGIGLLVTAIVTLAISWLSVALRTYVRAGIIMAFQIDDWVMLAGLANFTVSCCFVFKGLSYGLGRHDKSLSQEDEIGAIKYQALATASYISNMWLIKLSIGLFLFRLAARRRYKYILAASIIVVGIWSLTLFFWDVFQCSPISAQWDYTILANDPDSHCIPVDQIVSAAYALSALTVLSDWLYALLPIPIIWHVEMTSQAKWSVILVLGLGIFASIATLVRLGFLADLKDESDILHAGTDAMIWTLIEPSIAISAASLATIRPLLRQWKIRGFSHSERSHGTGNTQSHGQSRRIKGGRKMPAFGSHDVTLVDIESGSKYTGTASSSSTRIPASGFGSHKVPDLPRVYSLPSDTVEHGAEEEMSIIEPSHIQRTEITSDVFLIEGTPSAPSISDTHTIGTWLDPESDSSSTEFHRSGNAIPSIPTPSAHRPRYEK